MGGQWFGPTDGGAAASDEPLTFVPAAEPVPVSRRKSYTVHLGPAGRITLASRDNTAAGAYRPATLRMGARGSVLMIAAAALRQPPVPPIPPE